MKESRFYIKRLTVAEAQVDDNNVHEIYIRLSNDFDYKSFFQNEGVVNGSVRQIEFTVEDLTYSSTHKNYNLRFVYYENSNHEKRIPSLSTVFREHGVMAGDTVCLESRTIDGKTSFYITFNKPCDFPLSGDSLYYSVKENSVNQLELYKTLTNEQRENVFAHYIEHFDPTKIGKDQISKYSHTYIPHINKYATQVSGITTLFDVISLNQIDQINKIAAKDKSPDPNYAGSYKSSLNKYARMLIELMSSHCQLDMTKFGASENDTKGLPLQKIVYGAPGTGKSHGTDDKIKEVYPDKNMEKKYVFRTTFHPDSDYSTFVGCYKPTKNQSMQLLNKQQLTDILYKYKHEDKITFPETRFGAEYWESLQYLSTKDIKDMLAECSISDNMSAEIKQGIVAGKHLNKVTSSGGVTYEFVPQSFTKAYFAAWKTKLEGENKPVFLVIEEINRGNCAQIFGDLFQLLDRKGGFSEYPIKPDTDLGNYLREEFQKAGLTSDEYKAVVDGEELILPNNLYIWATMNTSDQSLFPIDSAFKRRWDWEYMPIDKGTDEDGKELEWKIKVGEAEYDWWSFLTIINDLIASDPSLGEDKQLGYFFCKAKEGIIDEKMFVNKVCFYLWNDVFKDFLPTHKALQTTDESSKSRNIRFTDFFKEGHTALINNFLKELGVKEYTSPASAETESAEDEDDDEEGLSDTQRQYRKLWGEFLSYAGSKSDFKSRFNLERKPSKENWMNFRFGANDCYLSVTQLLRDKEVSVALYFNEETPTYHDLHAQSEQIHADLGFELDWINKSENKCSMAVLRKKNADFDDESKKQEQFEFIVGKLLKMREVFSKYLNLSTEA